MSENGALAFCASLGMKPSYHALDSAGGRKKVLEALRAKRPVILSDGGEGSYHAVLLALTPAGRLLYIDPDLPHWLTGTVKAEQDLAQRNNTVMILHHAPEGPLPIASGR